MKQRIIHSEREEIKKVKRKQIKLFDFGVANSLR